MKVCVINQKGGSGKTTTVEALGQGLQSKGFKVLFSDLDQQGNLTYALRSESNDSIYNALLGKSDVRIINDLISSSPLLASIGNKDIKDDSLKKILDKLDKEYDYILIDTSPSLNILTINALTAADKIIIVSQADIFSIQGILQLQSSIEAVKERGNKNLKVEGILLTKYNNRTILNRDLKEAINNIAKELNTKVFNTTIRESVALREAQTQKENLFTYAKNSKAIEDYLNFIDEFLGGKK